MKYIVLTTIYYVLWEDAERDLKTKVERFYGLEATKNIPHRHNNIT